MAKILFFNIPAYGHVNPTLPAVTELVRRGHQLVYYDADAFQQALKATGAEFRAYPNSSTFEAELAGVAAFLGSLCGSSWVPAKRRCLVPPTSG
jgi:UDP:flavonoid glycosyltransferase YjiC (YdhE family)